jgi:YihY family inner membrane protein
VTWSALHRLDEAQRDRAWLAFPVAVAKKFGDDRAGSLAALIAYYGFFSLFPLLMVLVTVSGLVLRDHPGFRDRLLESAVGEFPVVGSRIAASIAPLQGSGWVIAAGVLTALWAGMAGFGAAQRAMDDVWDVPRRDRPPFVRSRLRALAMLTIIGTFLVAVSISTAALTAIGDGIMARSIGVTAGVVLNTAVALAAFRVLTVADTRGRALLPGALLVGICWSVLQGLGGLIVDHQVRGASDTYGFFGVVIGLLGWIYLAAQVFLTGAELNVVRERRLWPRRLFPPLAPGDRRAIVDEAHEQAPRPEIEVEARFLDRAGGVGGERGG